MRTITLCGALVAGLLLTAQISHADTPGYDRPGSDNHQKDGSQRVVYWSDFFDHMTVPVAQLGNATSTDDYETEGAHHSHPKARTEKKLTVERDSH